MSLAELATSPEAPEGETIETAPEGTTVETSPAEAGPATSEGRTHAAPSDGSGDEDSFFDPSTLPPELLQGYKQMQAAYSKKTAGLAQQRRELERMAQYKQVVDAFERDPVGTLKALNQQYGLTPAQAQQAVSDAQQQTKPIWEDADYQPAAWNELAQRMYHDIRTELVREFQNETAPLKKHFQQVTAQQVETQLDQIDPEWRTYEPEMIRLLEKHPSMKQDVGSLYRLAVPPEVLEQRATQAALEKWQRKQAASKVTGGKTVKTTAAPAPPKSFAEAYERAKANPDAYKSLRR